MVTLIIGYDVASPDVIGAYVCFFGCGCGWTDIDEDCYEFYIFSDDTDLVEAVMIKVMENFIWG